MKRINLFSNKRSNAIAAAEGKVVRVLELTEEKYAVLLKHGYYFSLYSNLSKTNLVKEDIVNRGAVIGKLRKEKGLYKLHFELWKESGRISAYDWLKLNKPLKV